MSEILEWPEQLLPSSMNLSLSSNRKKFTSPFTGSSQQISYPGSRWEIKVSFDSLNDDEARELETLIFRMDAGGRIKLRDFGREPKQIENVIVFGSDQVGYVFTTSGWQSNVNLAMRKGDYITVNDELKMLTEDVSTAINGTAALHITPMLRSSPTNGSPISISSPYVLCRLKEDSVGVDRKPAFDNSFSLSFIEEFYP